MSQGEYSTYSTEFTIWQINPEKLGTTSQIHLGMMRAIWSSVACIAIAPVQDLLGLPSEARMNTPGTATGNWTWRVAPSLLSQKSVDLLREMTEAFGRC